MKILKIERIGVQECFDIEVKKNHNYQTESGAILHNCNYRGLIGVIMENIGKDTALVEVGDRIAQAVLAEVPRIEWVLVDSADELTTTDRGEGGFGSTGQQ